MSNLPYFDYDSLEGCKKALDFYIKRFEDSKEVIVYFETTMKWFRFPERRFRTDEITKAYDEIEQYKAKVYELVEIIKGFDI